MKARRIPPWRVCLLFYGAVYLVLLLVHFPYATDPPLPNGSSDSKIVDFYSRAYGDEPQSGECYPAVAQQVAAATGVLEMVRKFVAGYRLEHKRVLDVGAGQGYLQDMVEDYVGLDISPTASRYFHKPFVQASATAIPFRDNEFDAEWSIWVLEHIPNPESALREMRRVVKPGGFILLAPAWLCNTWAAGGYDVRPYSDLSLGGKLIKASTAVRGSGLFQMSMTIPIRAIRWAASGWGSSPTALHYRRLTPNYDKYWGPDSDAVNSLDSHEAVLWFESRGDRCLNCTAGAPRLTAAPNPLIIRVAK